jgi:hypothetical protein
MPDHAQRGEERKPQNRTVLQFVRPKDSRHSVDQAKLGDQTKGKDVHRALLLNPAARSIGRTIYIGPIPSNGPLLGLFGLQQSMREQRKEQYHGRAISRAT